MSRKVVQRPFAPDRLVDGVERALGRTVPVERAVERQVRRLGQPPFDLQVALVQRFSAASVDSGTPESQGARSGSRSVQVPVLPWADVAFGVERLAAERARRSAGAEHAARAAHEA